MLAQLDTALRDEDPMTLLIHASSMVNLTDPRNRNPFTDDVQEPELPPLEELLQAFSTSDQPPMHALAFAMAHLQPDELLRTRTLRRLDRATLPPWLAALGRVEAIDACLTVDELYDSWNVVLSTRVGAQQLTVVALVDFNLGTVVKDAFPLDVSMAEFGATYSTLDPTGGIQIRPVSPADARACLEPAIESGAITWPPFESETWPQTRPMLEWLLRLCPTGGNRFSRPEPTDGDQQQTTEDFFASDRGRHLDDADHRSLLDSVLWFGADYTYGDPLLLSPTKIEILMLDWFPRKIAASPTLLAKLPGLLAEFVPYGHRVRNVPARLTTETVAMVQHLTGPYRELITSPRRQGPEALLERMGLMAPLDDTGLDLGNLSDQDWVLQELAAQVGGPDELDRLDDDPLPDEHLDLGGVPADVHERVQAVRELCDGCCAALLDAQIDGLDVRDAAVDAAQPSPSEHRTAVRRLLHDVAAGDPMIFRRRSRNDTTAAALCWLVVRANVVGDHGGVQTKTLMAHFGLTGSPSQRAEPMRRAAGLPTDYWRSDLGSVRYLTGDTRRDLILRRDRWRPLSDEEPEGT